MEINDMRKSEQIEILKKRCKELEYLAGLPYENLSREVRKIRAYLHLPFMEKHSKLWEGVDFAGILEARMNSQLVTEQNLALEDKKLRERCIKYSVSVCTHTLGYSVSENAERIYNFIKNKKYDDKQK